MSGLVVWTALASLAWNALYAAILYAGVRAVLAAWSGLRPAVSRIVRGRPGAGVRSRGHGTLSRTAADLPEAGARGRSHRAPRELPPVVELALWSAVAVRLVLPPGLAAPWSLRSLSHWAAALVGLGGGAADTGLPFDPSILLGPLGAGGGGEHAGAASGAVTATPWLLALAGVWLGGAIVCLVRFAEARRRVRRRIAAARVLDAARKEDRPLVLAARRWRRALGLRRPVRLVVGEGSGSPLTVGVLRPVIWLPARMVRADRSAGGGLAEAALAHELIHVRGLDDLWLRLLAVVRALYYFHPVAWWVSARIADARERSVDDAVLDRHFVAPRTYGRALLATLAGPDAGGTPEHPADRDLLPAFGSPQRSTPMRIHRIVRRHADPQARRSRRAVTLSALGLAVLVACAALPMAAAPSALAAPAGHDQAAKAHWTAPVHHARVTSPFGERHDPLTAAHPSQHHDGVDLGAPAGTPVLASADGVVTVATEHYGPAPHWGTVVVVDHGNGLETRYAHLGTLAVTVGQKVARGDALGTVGATGKVTGPHLHFEVLRDGTPVDPATLVTDLTD